MGAVLFNNIKFVVNNDFKNKKQFYLAGQF